jgi:SAM-dependent methyltransferase
VKILDLGCGNKKGCGCPYTGKVVGVDIDTNSQADVLWDLEKFPYPFKNNEFDAIYAHHSLEHLEDTNKVMDELWRITKPNGRVKIMVPFGTSTSALQNPTHKRFFSVITIQSYTNGEKPKFRLLSAKLNYVVPINWKRRILKIATTPVDWFINANHYFYEKLLRYYCGDADEIEWELEVIK